MTTDTMSAADIMLATIDDLGIEWGEHELDYCIGYAEPGYGATDTVVVFADWNATELAPLADTIEATDGAGLEWSDEWHRCDECYRAVRIEPDSYSWRPYYAWVNECEIICADCLREDVAGNLEQYRNDPDNAVTWASHADMVAAGWERWAPADPRTFETGWHPGQTDDPRSVLDMIREETDADVVFLIDSTGQFDMRWSAWVEREDAGEDA